MSNTKLLTIYKRKQAEGKAARVAFAEAMKETAAATPTPRKASALNPPPRKPPTKTPISVLIPPAFLPKALLEKLIKMRG